MPNIIEMMECRVVVLLKHSRSVLAVRTPGGYRFPSIQIAMNDRPARQIREAMSLRWALDIFVLDLLSLPESDAYAVAEPLTAYSSPHLEAMGLNQFPLSELNEHVRCTVSAMLRGESVNNLIRVGWFDEACEWLQRLTRKNISSRSLIEQHNAGGAFSLIRFITDDGSAYWLKATGEPNRHELPVTLHLSRKGGAYLPQVLADKPEWNAWITTGQSTDISSLKAGSDELQTCLEDAAEALAILQITMVDEKPQLLNAGAFDQEGGTILKDAETMFAAIENAMSLQTSSKVAQLTSKRIRELGEMLSRILEGADALGLPNTILHGDMHLGNILRTPTHCQFIDWCEAYVGYPLVTLQHLLLLNSLEDPLQKKSADRKITDRYSAIMSQAFDAAVIEKGLHYMPFLAAVSTLYGRGADFQKLSNQRPQRLAYIRTVARYLDRAANDPKLMAVAKA